MDFKTEVKSITESIDKLKNTITEIEEKLPDNPDIQRLSERSFVIQSSQLSADRILSPYYYDFREQYRMIFEILDNANIEEVITILHNIIDRKSITYKGASYRIHPKVIENISTALEL